MLTSYKRNPNEDSQKQKTNSANAANVAKFQDNNVILIDKITEMRKGCQKEQGSMDNLCEKVRTELKNQVDWVNRYNEKREYKPGLVEMDPYTDAQKRLDIVDKYTCNCGQESQCPMYQKA